MMNGSREALESLGSTQPELQAKNKHHVEPAEIGTEDP